MLRLNLLVICAMLSYGRVRKHVTTPFIISLSCTDLTYSAIILPVLGARFATQVRNTF